MTDDTGDPKVVPLTRTKHIAITADCLIKLLRPVEEVMRRLSKIRHHTKKLADCVSQDSYQTHWISQIHIALENLDFDVEELIEHRMSNATENEVEES